MGFNLPIQDPILQFTLLATMALLVQLTVQRLHLPGLIGLILGGMVIGPGALGVLPREPVADLLGQVGLVYIMFLAGVEVDLVVLKKHKSEASAFGLLSFALTAGLTLPVALLMQFSWSGALLLAAALSSHTLVAYPMLQKMNLLGRPPVVTAVGGTLLTDTLSLITLAIVTQTIGRDQAGAWGWLAPLVLLAALVAVAMAIVPRLAQRLFTQTRISRAEKALFVLVVVLLLASLTEVSGTEAILGAFLAGLCLNRPLRHREELHEHLGFVGQMIFIPFFFVDTGMRIDLNIFAGEAWVWAVAAAALAVVVVGKSAAVWLTGWYFNYGSLDRLLMIGLTTPQAAATLAVTVTASELGALDSVVVDAMILVILVTCLSGPLLCGYTGRRFPKQPDSGFREETGPNTGPNAADRAGDSGQSALESQSGDPEEPKKDFV
jgi:Kef-type K+ transport system membrane component KefB